MFIYFGWATAIWGSFWWFFWQRPHHGIWPRLPASYKMTLENSRPTACCFQWNSWKIWSNHFRQPHWGHFWPLTSYWGIKMLEQQKKVSVLHLSICSFGDQSSQLILCLENLHFPWSGLSRSQKMKILLQQRNFAIELCHLWAVLQMQHRTFIPCSLNSKTELISMHIEAQIFREKW